MAEITCLLTIFVVFGVLPLAWAYSTKVERVWYVGDYKPGSVWDDGPDIWKATISHPIKGTKSYYSKFGIWWFDCDTDRKMMGLIWIMYLSYLLEAKIRRCIRKGEEEWPF